LSSSDAAQGFYLSEKTIKIRIILSHLLLWNGKNKTIKRGKKD
jgi:hypothetical protein